MALVTHRRLRRPACLCGAPSGVTGEELLLVWDVAVAACVNPLCAQR